MHLVDRETSANPNKQIQKSRLHCSQQLTGCWMRNTNVKYYWGLWRVKEASMAQQIFIHRKGMCSEQCYCSHNLLVQRWNLDSILNWCSKTSCLYDVLLAQNSIGQVLAVNPQKFPLEQSKLSGMYNILIKSNLIWAGLLKRLEDRRNQKKILYS